MIYNFIKQFVSSHAIRLWMIAIGNRDLAHVVRAAILVLR